MKMTFFAVYLFVGPWVPSVLAQDGAYLDGRVVKVGSGSSVPGVDVVLTMVQGSLEDVKTATTDESGKFQFHNIRPGSYRLFASSDGYLRSEYRQSNAIRVGTPFVLVAGQSLKDLIIPITPTGVIAGKVFASNGEPMREVRVKALKSTYRDGEVLLQVVQSAKTNDLGEYRLFGLPPGSYLVSAAAIEPPRVEGAYYVIPTIPTRENYNATDTRLRGEDAVAQGRISFASLVSESEQMVFFPGVVDASGASPVVIRAGTAQTEVNVKLPKVITYHVRGKILNANGQVETAVSVGLNPHSSINVIASQGQAPFRGGLSENGEFDFAGVPAGTYTLSGSNVGMGIARADQSATIPVIVGTTDVDGVTLQLRPSYAMSGKVTIEGHAQGANDSEMAKLTFDFGATISPRPDGEFTLASVKPGEYRLRAVRLSENSYIKSARLGSVNLLDGWIRIEAAPTDRIAILVSPNGASLDTLVVDSNGRPVQDVVVALIPDPPGRNRYDLYKNAITDSSGHVHVVGIAPGDYNLFAWVDVEPNSWQIPDILRIYEGKGERIHFQEGSKEVVSVNVIPATKGRE